MRILIADDHAVVRAGLTALLERQTGLEVVGQADNGETAVALAKDLAPDLVIMDVCMPRLSGVEAIRQICTHNPVVKIVVLSMHSENTIVTEALTGRERQILQFVSEGLSIKEIGRRLQISPKTVDATRRNLSRKLHVQTVAQLTKFAIREGLTSAEF